MFVIKDCWTIDKHGKIKYKVFLLELFQCFLVVHSPRYLDVDFLLIYSEYWVFLLYLHVGLKITEYLLSTYINHHSVKSVGM